MYSYFITTEDLGEAAAYFNAHWDGEVHDKVAAPGPFILYNAQKFQETGTVQDRPHHPDTKKVSDELAKQCAAALKRGFFVWRPHPIVNLPPVPLRRFWTSINKACREQPLLRAVTEFQQVSPQYLLKRMHQVDKDLVWRTVDYKPEKLGDNMKAGVKNAKRMLRRIERFPALLRCIYWIDWVTIYLVDKRCKLHAYMDAHDHGAFEVMHIEGLPRNTTIKAHAIAVVNYDEGPFYMEMGTGTTDLVRINNVAQRVYTVSLK